MTHRERFLLTILILIAVGVGLAYGIIPYFMEATYKPTPAAVATVLPLQVHIQPEVPVVTHIQTPESVRAIYMSSCVAGTPSFRDSLVAVAETTEVNSIVIDIKDYSGYLSFKPQNPALLEFVSPRCRAPDMQEFIARLHAKNIYVIGRVTSFQDPVFAKLHPDIAVKRESDGGIWSDRKGIHYLDPGAKIAWDHLAAIAKDSYAIGFDEINFDYIRFPSDGNMRDIAFPASLNQPKPVVMEKFFTYLRDTLKPTGMIISADLFGMTTTNVDDLGIGQVLERALPYFDYIAPMVYPSHYPPTFIGYKNPADHPYEVIKYAMDGAVRRTTATSTFVKTSDGEPIASTTPKRYTKNSFDKHKIRPWLQDFNLGAVYTADMVRAQIQATYDSGLNSWMLWAPSNRYTKAALLSQDGSFSSSTARQEATSSAVMSSSTSE
jgi:hypothetical protein